MRRIIKMSLFILLFAGLGLFNMGGCGGGGGVDPVFECELPPLNSDFSDSVFIFFDPFTGLTMGVSSDGEVVEIALVDLEEIVVGAIATPISAFACLIFEGGIIGEDLFDASGSCARSDDAELFSIFDFFILDVLIVEEAIGVCFAVVPLDTATAQAVEDATVRAFLDMQSRGELGDADSEGIIFGDILEELESN